MKKIALASDHAGFEYKKEIIKHLENKGYEIKDFGTYSTESVDYPDYIHPLATAVENKEFDFGIIMCGTGLGVSITANKHQGIRAALCWDVEIAKLARQHNDANILALSTRFVPLAKDIEIVDIFLTTDFEGGRHAQRVEKIPCK